MKYALYLQRFVGQNVVDTFFINSYDSIKKYLNASNALIEGLKATGAYLCCNDVIREDVGFTYSYVTIK